MPVTFLSHCCLCIFQFPNEKTEFLLKNISLYVHTCFFNIFIHGWVDFFIPYLFLSSNACIWHAGTLTRWWFHLLCVCIFTFRKFHIFYDYQFHQQCVRVPFSPYPLQQLTVFELCIVTILTGVGGSFPMILICIFINTEYIFIDLLAILCLLPFLT